MAGECDQPTNKTEVKPVGKTEKRTEEIRDENLLEDILVNPNPKSKTNKIDPLAQILNVRINI